MQDKKIVMLISQEIERINSVNLPVIVEGRKDKKSLQELGLNNIIMLNSKPLFEIVESINSKKVVLLTDLDAEGKKLYGMLKSGLTSHGIQTDDQLRRLLLKAKVVQIESLYGTMQKWKSQLE